MPSTSAKQAKFMQAIAHSPSFAKKVGVKQSVGKDFNMADKKTRKFGNGGTTPVKPKPKPKPPATGTNGLDIPKEGYNDPYERMPPKMKPTPPKPLGPAGKKGYAAGGVTKIMPTSKQMGDLNMAKGGVAKGKTKAKGKGNPFAATKFGAAMMKKSADTEGRAMKKMAKGGGIESRGKTKTKKVTMKNGGSC